MRQSLLLAFEEVWIVDRLTTVWLCCERDSIARWEWPGSDTQNTHLQFRFTLDQSIQFEVHSLRLKLHSCIIAYSYLLAFTHTLKSVKPNLNFLFKALSISCIQNYVRYHSALKTFCSSELSVIFIFQTLFNYTKNNFRAIKAACKNGNCKVVLE